MDDKATKQSKKYIDGDASPASQDATTSPRQSSQPPAKRPRSDTRPYILNIQALLSSNDDDTPSLPITSPPSALPSIRVNTAAYEMSDGKNNARALRMLEIMNDFRTLQIHITSVVDRPEATPPDQASANLVGYALLRQCKAQAQAILATKYNAGNLGLDPGNIPETEVQKATLQRILLDASLRRFQAHKIYLRSAAGMRWVQLRRQLMAQKSRDQADGMRKIDGRLQEEVAALTESYVIQDLRNADIRKGYWIDEDPSLERILAWERRNA